MSDGGELEKLVVRIEGDLSGIEDSLRQLVSKSQASAEGVGGHFGKMALSIAAAEVAVRLLEAGFEKLKELTIDNVKETLANIVAIERMSEKLGVATDKMGGLIHAADTVDVSMSSLSMALMFLERNMVSAANGTGPAAAAIKQLGLDTERFFALSPDEKFKSIADAMHTNAAASERASLSMAIFGRSGLEMVNVMALGSKGINEETEAAIKMGLAFSRVDAEKAIIAHQALNKIHETFEGMSNTLTIALAPIIAIVAKEITDVSYRAGGLKEVILQVVEAMVQGAGRAADVWRSLQIAMLAVNDSVASLAVVFWNVVNVFAKGFLQIGTFIANFIRIVWDIGDLIQQTFVTGFMIAGNAVVQFTKEALIQFSILLDKTAQGMVKAHLAGHVAVQEAAASVLQATYGMGEANEKAAKRSKEAWSSALDSVKSRIGNILPKEDETDTGWIQKRADQSVEAWRNAHDKLVEIWKRPMPGDAIDVWVAHMRAAINELAKAKSDAVEQDLAQTKSQNEQEVAWSKRTAQDHVGDVTGSLNGIAGAMDQHNRKQFQMAKELNLASAIISTAAGIAKTFSDFGWYALLGPAEAVAAAGAAQISQISRQQFGGGGGSPSVGASAGSAPNVNAQQQINQRQQAVNISLSGGDSSSYTGGQIRQLIQAINDQLNNGAVIGQIGVL